MNDVATTPMRDALAWATNDTSKAKEPSTNPFVWLWEAIEGDGPVRNSVCGARICS